MGTGNKNPSVEDIIAAKLKAKAEEAAREAAEEARGGGGDVTVSVGNNSSGTMRVGGSIVGRDQIESSSTVHGNQTIVHGDQFGGDKVGGDKFGGDKVGGDKVTVGRDYVTGTQTNTSGLTADDVAKLFDSLYKQIESKPKEDQPAIQDAVDTVKQAAQAEAVQGQAPDEKAVTAAAKSLAVDAPDILTDMADVALATLTNPASGVITIIRKIAEKVKASRGG